MNEASVGFSYLRRVGSMKVDSILDVSVKRNEIVNSVCLNCLRMPTLVMTTFWLPHTILSNLLSLCISQCSVQQPKCSYECR